MSTSLALAAQPIGGVAQDVEALCGGGRRVAAVPRREVAVDHRAQRVGQMEQRALLAAHELGRLLVRVRVRVRVGVRVRVRFRVRVRVRVTVRVRVRVRVSA